VGEGEREPPEGPPSDPEDWSDEQWIAWLKATDDETAEPTGPVTVAGRITHSPGGQVLGQTMLGLAQAMYGHRDDDVVVVVEAGEPDDEEPYTLHLDRDHPERSTVVFRDEPDPNTQADPDLGDAQSSGPGGGDSEPVG
jgi:hypothetical protein